MNTMIFLWKQPANSVFFFLFLCAMGSLRYPAEGEWLQGLLGGDLTEEQWWQDSTNTVSRRMDLSGCILQERLHSSSSSPCFLFKVSYDWRSVNLTFGFVPEVCPCSCFTEQEIMELWGSFWWDCIFCAVFVNLWLGTVCGVFFFFSPLD